MKFHVGIPSDQGRWDILVSELEKENLEEGFLKKLHQVTRGKTPAEITKMIQDAYKNLWSRVEGTDIIEPQLKDIDFGLK